ncbi:hypothetical protein ACFE04_013405 [Oxalis oulophora]
MASSIPPFNVVEDTDEDFFDKLVEDDFKGATSTATTSDSFVDEVDEEEESDDLKAFSNLSIAAADKEYVPAPNVAGQAAAAAVVENVIEKENEVANSSESLPLAAPTGYVNMNENENGEQNEVDDSKGNGSGGGVKEVGWGSFYADSTPNVNHGFGSYSDFFNGLGDNAAGEFPVFPSGETNGGVSHNEAFNAGGGGSLDRQVNYEQYEENHAYNASGDANGVDLNYSQDWENMYPGWKYDATTGQWTQIAAHDETANDQGGYSTDLGHNINNNYDATTGQWTQVDAHDATTNDHGGYGTDLGHNINNYETSEISYLKNETQSIAHTVTESSTTESVSNWNQVSPSANNGYPEHMLFDPQYPGWYYNVIAQEWQSLESYNSNVQSSVQTNEHHNLNGFAISNAYSGNNNDIHAQFGHTNSSGLGSPVNEIHQGSWADSSYGNYNQSNANAWHPKPVSSNETVSNFHGSQQMESQYNSKFSMNNHVDQHTSFNSSGTALSYDRAPQGNVLDNGIVGPRSFVPSTNQNFSQSFNQPNFNQKEMHFSNDMYGSQKPATFTQQQFHGGHQSSYSQNMERSSAGRPAHALVTFGFGGKLLVMKDSTFQNSSFGNQEPVGAQISVLNMMEVVTGNTNTSGASVDGYFHALCQQSFPGPLVGGSVGSKELNKWIDERIANCESSSMDYQQGKVIRLLLSLLKIACQHYGKLRSPFGTDTSFKESDTPEAAVAKLFASAKMHDTQQYNDFGALSNCLQNLPSEGQLRATASEVQNLLVSGRKTEALQCAQEGQLWGPALVLASQLGEQFYVDTVKQMALHQLAVGSPLRTLCLLIAGQPADVFTSDTITSNSFPGAPNMSQHPAQPGASNMLDNWEENLAVITANRTKDDELVIIHLGDSIWKGTREITAAHICYLVAEANFESYSDSARLCLIGSDHWKYPRTYASPEAIQRTELYEYSKVLGNSQFILQPFQPYKVIYAFMLAEVGKISDSLKYCQALLKSLKTGRAPEVETLKQLILSLEDRIRTHQQGGYTANLAPAKLVGKLLNFFDSTAHRVVGGLPPTVPSASQGHGQVNEFYQPPAAPRVSSSQSTMAMSSLMPSGSTEHINELGASDSNRTPMGNRSVSEPDFGRSQVDSTKDDAQGKAAGGTSRFGRFGFGSNLLQKTVGLVLGPRADKQAKLGDKNKFYYDEKLKRWVEEGVDPPAEEAALPPPPTSAPFQNGGVSSDYNLKSALRNEGSLSNGISEKTSMPPEQRSGIPPIPTGTNQFSARGRMGVRARVSLLLQDFLLLMACADFKRAYTAYEGK